MRSVADHAINHLGAMQKATELATLLEILDARRPHNVLEIGGMFGGTLWCWDWISSGTMVCVDNFTLEGRLEKATSALVNFDLIVGDSRSPRTRDMVVSAFYNEMPEFIFIDGDHRYDYVTEDAYNWQILMPPNGIMAFHDICHRKMEGHDMWRFWKDLCVGWSNSIEIYDPDLQWGGIGVIFGPEARVLSKNELALPFVHQNMDPPSQATTFHE